MSPESHPTGRPGRVEVVGDRVVKLQDPEHAAVEYEKTRRGRSIGQASGTFRVPEILSADLARGEIVFEFIEGLDTLRVALSEREDPTLLERAARALAEIHRSLELPDALMRPVRLQGFDGRSSVCVHGDYSLKNVFYARERDELVVLDWNMATWLDPSVTVGPRELDVANIVLGLFIQRPGDPHPVANPEILARGYLDAYRAASGASLADLPRIARRTRRHFMCHMLRSGQLIPFAIRMPRFLRFERFVRRLPSEVSP